MCGEFWDGRGGDVKARMRDNLIVRYQLHHRLRGEMKAVKDLWGWQKLLELKHFLKSIEGKEVTLVFTCGDAFEKGDNNVWLPKELWEKVDER